MSDTKPSDYELMDLYRTWWESSYGNKPNSQATIIAAAFGRHVLETYGLAYIRGKYGKKQDDE